ncbi:hypothetical protein CDG60_01915 [Acinetobacter chinensis]|uniref:Uncharacterized protein n=1 Tax=Acinetobacter chinensis TaxID=2004650 RepID=A0A3B7LU49_9GAMM|nr:hypothetical protein CDG60_01915 [Acinetobacter chinensis]
MLKFNDSDICSAIAVPAYDCIRIKNLNNHQNNNLYSKLSFPCTDKTKAVQSTAWTSLSEYRDTTGTSTGKLSYNSA